MKGFTIKEMVKNKSFIVILMVMIMIVMSVIGGVIG
mgnify:CR=1 FL=1